MGRLSAIAACLLLASCASKPVTSAAVCPSVRQFSAAWQDELATEVKGMPENSPAMQLIADWIRMRDEARACAE